MTSSAYGPFNWENGVVLLVVVQAVVWWYRCNYLFAEILCSLRCLKQGIGKFYVQVLVRGLLVAAGLAVLVRRGLFQPRICALI